MVDRKLVGRAGEELAVEILRKKGYDILATNYICKMGEVDIIAIKDGIIAFVEVKTRLDDSYGMGREAVNCKKRQHIRNCAKWFLTKEKPSYLAVDFQVIEISLCHLENLRF